MPPKKVNELYNNTGLSSHMEDYMETIWMLASEKKVVRVKDIAKSLNIKMPSVTAALNKLRNMDLIEYEKYGFIEITNKGRAVAELVHGRHKCLYDFFNLVLEIDEKSADQEACRVEHVLSPETCTLIHKFLIFFGNETASESEWIDRLRRFLKSGQG